jgi:hypothetical protein
MPTLIRRVRAHERERLPPRPQRPLRPLRPPHLPVSRRESPDEEADRSGWAGDGARRLNDQVAGRMRERLRWPRAPTARGHRNSHPPRWIGRGGAEAPPRTGPPAGLPPSPTGPPPHAALPGGPAGHGRYLPTGRARVFWNRRESRADRCSAVAVRSTLYDKPSPRRVAVAAGNESITLRKRRWGCGFALHPTRSCGNSAKTWRLSPAAGTVVPFEQRFERTAAGGRGDGGGVDGPRARTATTPPLSGKLASSRRRRMEPDDGRAWRRDGDRDDTGAARGGNSR